MNKIIILALLIVPLFLTGCTPKTYEEVSYNKLKTMIDNKEDFILLIGAAHCSACEAYKPTLNKVITDYHLAVKYIDLDGLSDPEYEYVLANFDITGTPTIVFVKKGQEVSSQNRIVGNEKYSKTVEILKENGYIKE